MQFSLLNPIDFKSELKTIDEIEKITILESLLKQIDDYSAPNLSFYENDINKLDVFIKLKQELKAKEYNVSEESLLHLPEYHARHCLFDYLVSHICTESE